MEEILKKADELGLLLKKTDTFRLFEEASLKVEEDDDAGTLLKRYNEIAESIQVKQEGGFPIESYETEYFKEITETVKNNTLLRDYLAAREEYMGLLLSIQRALGGSEVL